MLGAGAVGCYYGALLARAGVAVTLIGRAPHVAAIARDGVVVVEHEGQWQQRMAAATAVAAARDADLVIVAVKTPDTVDAVRLLAPHLSHEARLVSLQNGVDNAARIATVVAQPVYAAVVYVGATMDGPGRVRHTGGGDLVLGVPRELAARGDAPGDLAAIAAMFESTGIRCPVSADIEAALWTKLTINCAFNAVSALGHARYGRMAAQPDVRAVMEAAVGETVAVARAGGVVLDLSEQVAGIWRIADALGQQFSSTAQDVQRKKPTEIDALNGLVVRLGEARGIPTPVNRTLLALVRLRELDNAAEPGA